MRKLHVAARGSLIPRSLNATSTPPCPFFRGETPATRAAGDSGLFYATSTAMADKNITWMDLADAVYHTVGLQRTESAHLVAIAGSGRIRRRRSRQPGPSSMPRLSCSSFARWDDTHDYGTDSERITAQWTQRRMGAFRFPPQACSSDLRYILAYDEAL
jgi:hypothetical protein